MYPSLGKKISALCGVFLFPVLALLLDPPAASAATWIQYDTREFSGRLEHYEWDADSLVTASADPEQAVLRPISVTWRYYAVPQSSKTPQTPEIQEVRKSRVFCDDLGLATYFQERSAFPERGRLTTATVVRSTSEPADLPTSRATWDSSDGKLIRSVCHAVAPDWIPDFLVPQIKGCAGKSSGLCSAENRDLSNSVTLLVFRKLEVNVLCADESNPSEQAVFKALVDEAVARVLAEADRCADKACKMRTVNSMTDELNIDLARASQGLACEEIEKRISRIYQEKKAAKSTQG